MLVCRPAVDNIAVAPCGSVSGVGYIPTMVEIPQLTASEVAELEAMAVPFNYAEAGEFFAWPIAALIGIYLAAYAVGSLWKIVGDS